MDTKIQLYINTVKYLKLSQIYYRLKNRLNRQLYRRKLKSIRAPKNLTVNLEVDFLIPELDFDKEYLDRFFIKDIMNDKFTFINITNKVDLTNAWNDKDLQHLWRYNLHYFEYLFRLGYEYLRDSSNDQYYDKFKYLIQNWMENNLLGFGDGWYPYTISIRITSWISVYQMFKHRIISDRDFNERFIESIYLQYKYLKSNQEKDVLGNHYFENIKAIIIGSIFFEDVNVKEKFKEELIKQLEEQILEDGMHFELSPMYHKIILEDLIKITCWLKDDSIYNQLIFYIQKMIDVTFSFENEFGKTPAFNDSADGISKEYESLLITCKKYFDLTPQFKSEFESSGFYIIKDNCKSLIFDTGDICPSYLPAHGHCDALSFELSLKNKPIIVNSGTYMYQNGKWRSYFRSTASHNTVFISGKEQSQFWGSFRVAKRIKKVRRKQFDYRNIKFYAGSYISYCNDEHIRYIGNIDKSKIIVLDYVKSAKKENIESYLHFAPGVCVDIEDSVAKVVFDRTSMRIHVFGISRCEIDKGWYSDKFNVKEENKVLIFKKSNQREVFGYILDFGNSEIVESENELRIIGDGELIVKYDELGDLL